jgi:hypothetical protein
MIWPKTSKLVTVTHLKNCQNKTKKIDISIQYVFGTRLVVELVNYIGLQIFSVELFQPLYIVIIARKIYSDQIACNEIYRGGDTMPCWGSPFPSDRINNNLMA